MTTADKHTTKRTIDLDTFILAHGAHPEPDAGMCLLEAAAYIAGEEHTDHPKCVDLSLAAFGRVINDRMNNEERQMLKPLIPKLVGTKGSAELRRRRAFLLVDRHLRSVVPAFLRDLPGKPRPDLAEQFEGLPPIIDGKSAVRARDLARKLRDEVRSHLSPRAAADAAAYDAAAYAADAADAAAAYAAYAADAADAAAAYAAYAAAAYAAYAADAAAAYAAAADAFKALRRKTFERSVAAFAEAIDLTEAA